VIGAVDSPANAASTLTRGNVGSIDLMKSIGEPCNLRKCRAVVAPVAGILFTCGRPGRSLGSTASVSDEIADCWVAGLPKGNILNLVSLLGTKEDGKSEYRFYSFRGSHEHSAKPTFQAWLDSRHGAGRFRVHEYPTEDAGPNSLSDQDIESIRAIIIPLTTAGETVVVFDSFGSERTGQVCRALGFRR
jgi:hypothetical protein